MVLNNVVDAAAVDSNVLQLWTSEHHEQADELHVMCSWGPWPIQPIIINSRLPGKLRCGNYGTTKSQIPLRWLVRSWFELKFGL